MPAEQLDVFGGATPMGDPAGHARTTDPSTSHRAAAALDVSKACAALLCDIYDQLHLHDIDMFTDGDLAAWTGEDRNICARRRGDLTEGTKSHSGGFIEPVRGTDGTQDEVHGRRGRYEKLWRLTPKGQELARQLHQEVPST